MIENIEAVFRKFSDEKYDAPPGEGEYLKFKNIECKLATRPDLHAFILLDRLVPSNYDIVACAEHDEIWLDVEPDTLAKVATEEDIRDLVRCGVRLWDYSLCMFV